MSSYNKVLDQGAFLQYDDILVEKVCRQRGLKPPETTLCGP